MNNPMIRKTSFGLTLMKELPEDIALALEGLKQQAEAATRMLQTGDRSRTQLKAAHVKMSQNANATKTVNRYVMETKTTVPEVDPEALLAWLHDRNDLSIYHLKPTPWYMSACRRVKGETIYFITQFWGDVEACCGIDDSIEEAERMHRETLEFIHLSPCSPQDSAHQNLMAECLRPDLIHRVYTAKPKEIDNGQ